MPCHVPKQRPDPAGFVVLPSPVVTPKPSSSDQSGLWDHVGVVLLRKAWMDPVTTLSHAHGGKQAGSFGIVKTIRVQPQCFD